jgi:hypothetical protein
MAKKDSGVKDTLSILGKKVSVMKSDIDIDKTEKATQKLHSISKDGKKFRLTVDVPEEEYKKFKIHTVNAGKTVQDTLLELIKYKISQ